MDDQYGSCSTSLAVARRVDLIEARRSSTLGTRPADR